MRNTNLAIFAAAMLTATAFSSAAAPGGHMGGGFSGGPAGGFGSVGVGTSHAGASGFGGNAAAFGPTGSITRGPDPAQSQGQAAYRAAPETLLGKNSALDSQLQKLLPAGTTAQSACQAFSHLGQCVAAIHVANNLGISFDELKARTTGSGAVNLGTAIHDLAPDVSARREQRKAVGQAEQDLSSNMRISE